MQKHSNLSKIEKQDFDEDFLRFFKNFDSIEYQFVYQDEEHGCQWSRNWPGGDDGRLQPTTIIIFLTNLMIFVQKIVINY